MTPIVLASASAARMALLNGAGVGFTARPAPIDERAVEAPLLAAGATPAGIAAGLADAKALAVSHEVSAAFVVGADQTLDFDGERWVKPATLKAAREQLARLSGRTHTLASAVSVAQAGTVRWRHLETARLTMRRLTRTEIERYVGRLGQDVLLTVGGYKVEGLGIQLFERIEGDYFAIVGLPLLPLLLYLRSAGALA
jgi:septum formation protein